MLTLLIFKPYYSYLQVLSAFFTTFILHTTMDFKKLASELFAESLLLNYYKRQYRAVLGASFCVTCLIWTVIYPKLQPSTLSRHILWALLYLKNYPRETFLAIFLKINCTSVRKWMLIVIDALYRSFWVSTGHIVFYDLFWWFNYIFIMCRV